MKKWHHNLSEATVMSSVCLFCLTNSLKSVSITLKLRDSTCLLFAKTYKANILFWQLGCSILILQLFLWENCENLNTKLHNLINIARISQIFNYCDCKDPKFLEERGPEHLLREVFWAPYQVSAVQNKPNFI